MTAPVLALHRRLRRWPGGRWLFARAICLKAPYFASIAPTVTVLEPGRCEATLRHRRRVTNHIGTVHAIALCNLAELAAGLMTEATLPRSMRWIPKGMQVRYLRKAVGPMRATAIPRIPLVEAAQGADVAVDVTVVDRGGDTVFDACVEMWVSPRSARSAAG